LERHLLDPVGSVSVADVVAHPFGHRCRIEGVRIDARVTRKRPFTRSDEEAMTTTLFGSTSAAADRAMGGTHRNDRLERLSPRELEVLGLMAEGRSNRAIGEQLTVEIKTVETHVSSVFTKLGLDEHRHENRRVLAVLTFFGRERTDAGPS
jgi:DNA-binding NarL/FixJ family response regulator